MIIHVDSSASAGFKTIHLKMLPTVRCSGRYFVHLFPLPATGGRCPSLCDLGGCRSNRVSCKENNTAFESWHFLLRTISGHVEWEYTMLVVPPTHTAYATDFGNYSAWHIASTMILVLIKYTNKLLIPSFHN